MMLQSRGLGKLQNSMHFGDVMARKALGNVHFGDASVMMARKMCT